MRILIALGVEHALIWTDLLDRLAARRIAVFSPLVVCRNIIEDYLGVDADQGNVQALARDMQKAVDTHAQGTFTRMFLWFLQNQDDDRGWAPTPPGAPDHTWLPTTGVLLLGDQPMTTLVQSLKQGTLHDVYCVGFGRSWEPTPDQMTEQVPTVEQFMRVVDRYFGVVQDQEITDETGGQDNADAHNQG